MARNFDLCIRIRSRGGRNFSTIFPASALNPYTRVKITGHSQLQFSQTQLDPSFIIIQEKCLFLLCKLEKLLSFFPKGPSCRRRVAWNHIICCVCRSLCLSNISLACLLPYSAYNLIQYSDIKLLALIVDRVFKNSTKYCQNALEIFLRK